MDRTNCSPAGQRCGASGVGGTGGSGSDGVNGSSAGADGHPGGTGGVGGTGGKGGDGGDGGAAAQRPYAASAGLEGPAATVSTVPARARTGTPAAPAELAVPPRAAGCNGKRRGSGIPWATAANVCSRCGCFPRFVGRRMPRMIRQTTSRSRRVQLGATVSAVVVGFRGRLRPMFVRAAVASPGAVGRQWAWSTTCRINWVVEPAVGPGSRSTEERPGQRCSFGRYTRSRIGSRGWSAVGLVDDMPHQLGGGTRRGARIKIDRRAAEQKMAAPGAPRSRASHSSSDHC